MPQAHDPFRPASNPVADQPESADEAEDSVPVGSTREILAWVKDDKDRAHRALEVEESHDQPRKGAVARLKKILEKDDD